MEDLWTAMLSDEHAERAVALGRLADDDIASGIAAAELGLSQQGLHDLSGTTTDADAD